jgi:hypothetical protein
MLAKMRLLSAMAGLAILALPVTALASDHHHHWDQSGFARSAVTSLQPRTSFWRGNGVPANTSRLAFAHPNAGWNSYRHSDGNWMRNVNRGWNPPPAYGYRPSSPMPAYGYVPPPNEYAYIPPAPRSYFGSSAASYYGNGGYPNGYGSGYGYGNGNLMTLRDRLLQERAGAYQQLAIRERNGDSNGAHHLWNTINSLNRQLASIR